MKRSTKKKASKRRERATPSSARGYVHEPWFIERVRALILESGYWKTLFFSSESYPRKDRERLLAVTRSLKATWLALLNQDDAELQRISGSAARYLVAQGKGEDWQKTAFDLSAFSPNGERWSEPRGDVVPEKGQLGTRATLMPSLVSTLEWHHKKTADASALASAIVGLFESPFLLRGFFAEHNITDWDHHREERSAAVAKVVAQMLHDSRENARTLRCDRLIVNSAIAVGVKKSAANSLFDYERTAEKRAKRK